MMLVNGVFICARHFWDEYVLLDFDFLKREGSVKKVSRKPGLRKMPSPHQSNLLSLIFKCELGLPIIIHPEEAAEQVCEEDEAMGEHGTGDMDFKDGLDGPRTADE